MLVSTTWNGARGIKFANKDNNFIYIGKDSVPEFLRLLEIWQKERWDDKRDFPPTIT